MDFPGVLPDDFDMKKCRRYVLRVSLLLRSALQSNDIELTLPESRDLLEAYIRGDGPVAATRILLAGRGIKIGA